MSRVLAVLVLVSSAASALHAQIGPDLTISEVAVPSGVVHFGSAGGIEAYGWGVTTCNLGGVPAQWIADTPEHPIMVRNLYRLENDRFEQIGMSWVSHEFCALGTAGCGSCGLATPCEQLGAGCATPTSGTVAGSVGVLGPRSDVDISTSSYVYPPTLSPSGSSPLLGRLQVATTDIDPALHPTARYFAEIQVASLDDQQFGVLTNNVSWRELDVLSPSALIIVADTHVGEPALAAWVESDPTVMLEDALVPGEGRFWLASRVEEIGPGTWRYDYTLFNESSHRSARSFTVPIPAAITDATFHDVAYHSGEIYSGSDWTFAAIGATAQWETDPFTTDANANALRWSTAYSFGFTCGVEPIVGTATVGLFRPGTPDTIEIEARIPMVGAVSFRRGDANVDGGWDVADSVFILASLFTAGSPLPNCLSAADVNDDGTFDISDAIYGLAGLFTAGAPPPPAPWPGCGSDPTPDALGCASFPPCP
ncbi:MAG: hypothetical protein KDC38_11055 [Planctomycetes bacterium]|nr:hypothetical protein [Planctomycetota bacterium]